MPRRLAAKIWIAAEVSIWQPFAQMLLAKVSCNYSTRYVVMTSGIYKALCSWSASRVSTRCIQIAIHRAGNEGVTFFIRVGVGQRKKIPIFDARFELGQEI
jgi:hypothetical protein